MKHPTCNQYIGVTTNHYREAADFYIRHFGFTVNAEGQRHKIVQAPNGKRVIGFAPPSEEKGLVEPFSGIGIHLAFLVDDAEAAMKDFQQSGVPIKRGLKIEDWGEKHFVIADPAGIEIYISESLHKNG